MNALAPDDDYLSPGELRAAVDEFQGADWIRLRKIASIHAMKCKAEWQEILDEAMCRALDGTRKCRKNLSIIVFFDGAMRSIVSSWNKEAKTEPTEKAMPLLIETEEGRELTVDPPDSSTPDLELEVQEKLTELEELFEDDDEATMVLMGQQDNLSPSEIQELTGLNQTQYATVLRQLRRRCEKLQFGNVTS